MTVVGPITSTRVPIVYDTDNGGFGGPSDMQGPEIGTVAYAQPADNLHIDLKLEFGQPGTTYQIFLVCGPSHGLACGFSAIGTVITDAAGAGSASITVPFAVLHGSPFGPGFRTDHIDLLHNVGDLSKGVLTAGAINYFVCRERVHPGAAEMEQPTARAETGDPAGAPVGRADPGGAR